MILNTWYAYISKSMGYVWSLQEKFEDTKGVIGIRISKKNRQHNGQKKKYKRTNNDLQNIHIKLKIEYQKPH
jgi:hypothetical protein